MLATNNNCMFDDLSAIIAFNNNRMNNSRFISSKSRIKNGGMEKRKTGG